MADAHKNFAYSTVASAPSPASSGTSLDVVSGHGTRFPTPPFNATVWPLGNKALPDNAEIVRVTNISTDTFTITRTQEGTSARSIEVGDQIAATITAKTVETYTNSAEDSSTRTLTGTGYEDITGTSITWTPTEGATYLVFATVMYRFASANWAAMRVRCLVDGATTGVTPTTQWCASNNANPPTNHPQVATLVFILSGLSAASHTLKLQSDENSSGIDREFKYTNVTLVKV